MSSETKQTARSIDSPTAKIGAGIRVARAFDVFATRFGPRGVSDGVGYEREDECTSGNNISIHFKRIHCILLRVNELSDPDFVCGVLCDCPMDEEPISKD